MKVLSCIFLIVAVAALSASAQSVITAQFTVTASQYNKGFFSGTLFYDWNQQAMLLQFPKAGQYAEMYIFNSFRGYPGLATGQFSGQYKYKNSSVCSCETSTLTYAMPPFHSSLSTIPPAWSLPSTTPTTFPLGQCYERTANPLLTASSGGTTYSYALVSNIWSTASDTLCAFKLFDGRVFTLQDTSSVSIPARKFVPPSGCKCGKPLDIVLSLDRTGSIRNWMWKIEHEFTKNLSLAFDYGPLKTNMGIVNWNKIQWTTLELTAGVSASAVSTAINAMGCCSTNTASTASCCCCGTPIGGGIWAAGQMLLTSTRPSATKVAIVLTDGCQNHIWDIYNYNPPKGVPCACNTEKDCAALPSCVADISAFYNLVSQQVPGVKIISVGVGDDTTICTEQLSMAAGGNLQNVYNPRSWAALSTIVDALSATTCTVDDSSCTGCCGICSCGQCIKPVNCTAPDMCTTAFVDTNSQCCTTAPVVCPPVDKCNPVICDPAVGCQVVPTICRPATNCTRYDCDLADGICKSGPTGNPDCNKTVIPPECFVDGDCDDDNFCTTDKCLNDKCVWNVTDCGTSDKCVLNSCNPTSGCSSVTTMCDDSNNCTTDSCDPATGCVFTNKPCAVSDDKCLITTCDKVLGCVTTKDPCKNITATNCTIPVCLNSNCTTQDVCIAPPPPTGISDIPVEQIIGTSLGVAALVGIIIAAIVVFLGLAGGGAYAFAGAGAIGGASAVTNNPIYIPNDQKGVNPLFRPT